MPNVVMLMPYLLQPIIGFLFFFIHFFKFFFPKDLTRLPTLNGKHILISFCSSPKVMIAFAELDCESLASIVWTRGFKDHSKEDTHFHKLTACRSQVKRNKARCGIMGAGRSRSRPNLLSPTSYKSTRGQLGSEDPGCRRLVPKALEIVSRLGGHRLEMV